MAKKDSGLGRGLGELLEDNAPEVRHTGTVVRKDQSGSTVHVTTPPPPNTAGNGYIVKPKGLYDGLPKQTSLKANFKNFK